MTKQLLGTALTCIAVVAGTALWQEAPVRAFTTTTCPATDPYDTDSDTVPLQECLDEYDVVMLEPSGGSGYEGYYIGENDNKGLRIRAYDGKILMTNREGKAHLVAAPDLEWQVIDVDEGATNWELHQLVIDGNRYNRDPDVCGQSNYNFRGSNVLAKGSGFYVVGVESVRALCGSAFEIWANGGEVQDSLFYDNGTDANAMANHWSDGITVLYCDSCYIHDNSFVDNSDVDLVVGSGSNLYVAHNDFEHYSNMAFAGLTSSRLNPAAARHGPASMPRASRSMTSARAAPDITVTPMCVAPLCGMPAPRRSL